MNADELYDGIVALIPINVGETDDYRNVIKIKLKNYVRLLNSLDKTCQPDQWSEVIKRVIQLCDGINRAVDAEYRGIRHSAYESIKNQLDGYTTHKSVVTPLSCNILSVKTGMEAYRMRKVDIEDRRKLKSSDMFHIPLNKRGLVRTQRFSVIGYPCLYMSHSIYGCWEEMGRPDFGTVMVSKLVAQKDFNVLDLRVATKEQWDKDKVRCIKFFPLVIASMIQVKNDRDYYKPEYLIPQLLTEWVISRNRDKRDGENQEIIGIIYTSVQKNSDFDFPSDSYDNYAIPVLKPFSRSLFCDRLIEMFKITKPTYYDLEILKHNETIDCGQYDESQDKQQINNLRTSHFGKLESFLKNCEVESIIQKK